MSLFRQFAQRLMRVLLFWAGSFLLISPLYGDWNYYVPPGGIASITISEIIKDSQKRVWLASGYHKGGSGSGINYAGAGISLYNHRIWTTYTTSNGLPHNDVNALAIDGSGNVWAATEAGIARFDGTSWSTLSTTAKVRDVAVESNGTTLWFATQGSGVLRYSGASFTTYDTSNSGLTDNDVTSVALTSDGKKFFGTDGGHLFELNAGNTTWTQHIFASAIPGAVPSTVWTVFADSSNNVWAGTHGAGVYFKSSASNSFTTNYTTSNGLAYNFIHGIGQDRDGTIWFVYGVHATTNSAVITKRAATGTFTTFNANAVSAGGDGFPSSNMVTMFFDDTSSNRAKRDQWFGTVTNGAARFGFPHTVPGWPITIPGGTSTNYVKHSSPALADLDGDGLKEIIFGSLSGEVFVYKPNGALLWKAKSARGSAINSSPAVGDLDNDGRPEIVIGYGTNETGHIQENGGIVCFSHAGAIKWEKTTFSADGDNFTDGVFSTPAIADIDGDGLKDVVIGAWDQNIYAVQWDGSPVIRIDNDSDGRVDEDGSGDTTPAPYHGDGCPGLCGVDDDADTWIDEGHANDDDEDSASPSQSFDVTKVEEDPPEWPRNNQDSVWSSPAVADLQGDGDIEIAIGGDASPGGEFGAGGTFRVMNADGTRENSGWHKGVPQVIWSSPALADLDNDGKLEIIVGNGHFYSGVPSKLYVFRVNGSGYLNPDGTFANLPEYIFGSPAVGDINGDGSPDIVVGALNGLMYAWDRLGNLLSGWPVEPNPGLPGADILSSPVIGDIDGDDQQEVLVGVGGIVYAIRGNGSIVPGFGSGETTTISRTIFNSVAVGDIDNDGITDIVLVNGYSNDGGPTIAGAKIYRWMGGAFTKTEWPFFRNDIARTGLYKQVPKDTTGGNAAIQVSSDLPVIVEKAEYQDATVNGELISNAFGANSVGSITPSLTWYFPDVNTQKYNVQLMLMNPNEKDTASVTVNYLVLGGGVIARNLTIGPNTRATIGVNSDSQLANKDMAVVVTSNVKIVAEKVLSFSGTMRGQVLDIMGGTATTGAPKALTQWYLAEGSTAGWKLWYIIMNPSSSQNATVTFNYLIEGGFPVAETFSLGPHQKRTVYVNDVLPFANVSLLATSNIPVVVERIMHWDAHVAGEVINNVGGHSSVGIEKPERLWYFAEGSTAGWNLWVLLMNPHNTSVNATVTWLREGAPPIVQNYTLVPNSRKTIEVRRIPGLEFANISVKVESSGLPIIAERAMYWDPQLSFGTIFNKDGHNSPGVNQLSTNWYMPSGSTRGQRTYVLIMNISSQVANVTIKMMTEDGRQIVRRIAVPGNSRKSIQLNAIWGTL